MSASTIVLPKGFLQSLTGKHVHVKLKWGMAYRGEWEGGACCARSCTRAAAASVQLRECVR